MLLVIIGVQTAGHTWEENDMTNEQAYVILENCASLLYSGTRFFPENHVKQFHEAYELAMEALRKTERKHGRWIPHEDEDGEHYGDDCSVCGAWYVMPSEKTKFCPDCGADMQYKKEEDDNV